MFYVFYGLIALGAAVLLADAGGYIVVAPERVRIFRIVGLIAATVVGFTPVYLMLTVTFSWPYPAIVIAYLVAYIAFVAGTLGLAGTGNSARLQRAAYAALLLLVAIPSFFLLYLAPAVALASAALVRPDLRAAERVTEFKSAALRPDPPREEE